MEGDSTMEKRRRREVERRVLDKAGEVTAALKAATRVDDVVSALGSLAPLLFPPRSSLASSGLDGCCAYQVEDGVIAGGGNREEWRDALYRGPAFPMLARVLLVDVASNWLPCFPFSAREKLYDVFFVDGVASEVMQVLVHFLQHRGNDGFDVNAVQSNVERLLVLFLLENNGVLQIVGEFGSSNHPNNLPVSGLEPIISRVAQIVASIPDKARPGAPRSISSRSFFKHIINQLLDGVIQRMTSPSDHELLVNNCSISGALLFAGEIFSRVCRRGSADVLMAQLIPRVVGHVKSLLFSGIESEMTNIFGSHLESQFWLNMMEAITDPYSVERISEHLLLQLEMENVTDSEAYWIMWILYSRIFRNQPSVRSMFVDKFLLWKVFPIRCGRWIIQHFILQCPPLGNSLAKGDDIESLLEVVQRLASVWSKTEFVQSVPLEQQAYVTAMIGLCMELMSKEELDKSKDIMHSILQGVSCRLENPAHIVRKMASAIALAFSKAIDPKNPLYLDDTCLGETVDWEFGMIKPKRKQSSSCVDSSRDKSYNLSGSATVKELEQSKDDGEIKYKKGANRQSSQFPLINPDEIVDPVTLNYDSFSDKGDNDDASECSDSSDDSSLQPYDLTDDDSDLKRKFSNLVDVAGALRKSDDADGVERALQVTEKLVRASPDELMHLAGDLARTLVQVRCSDVSVEGEEDSAEEKRQRSLVGLLVTCPFQSLDTLNKLLYSPNVDTSQRIMILDVMTEAAQELADSKIMKRKLQSHPLISTITENQPWFLPRSSGPPGAGLWREVSETGSPLNYSHCYERELPPSSGIIRKGKTRRWSVGSGTQQNQWELASNRFPVYAAAFMLPAMQGFDKKRHGVDLLGRDFIVLGKLIYMLGVCMRCVAMHPEATALAPALLDMLKSRDICHHKEAYVRRAVLFAASCILMALHPSFVASSLTEGNAEVSEGLEWVRAWALKIVESDTDRDCYTMAISCLQLHSEMALQASRALESGETALKAKVIAIPPGLSRGIIKIPNTSAKNWV